MVRIRHALGAPLLRTTHILALMAILASSACSNGDLSADGGMTDTRVDGDLGDDAGMAADTRGGSDGGIGDSFVVDSITSDSESVDGLATDGGATDGGAVEDATPIIDGIRQYGGLGIKKTARGPFNRYGPNWFMDTWNQYLAGPYTAHPEAFREHYPTITTRIAWNDVYVDPTVAPTDAQAVDPNWSGYKWNQEDSLTDTLNSPLIDNGDGVAKVAVMISLTATSGSWTTPEWMRGDSNLAWIDRAGGANGVPGLWHTRFDLQPGREHAKRFLTALLAKYGSNRGIHSIMFGEYYNAARNQMPSDYSVRDNQSGFLELWQHADTIAPRDLNGNRVNLIQLNPQIGGRATEAAFLATRFGFGESDTDMRFGDTETSGQALMRRMGEQNLGHTLAGGDGRYACNDRISSTWEDSESRPVPNPFAHNGSYRGVATPQELFWFHGARGPSPTHSFMLHVVDECPPQTATNFLDAIATFGRGGSMVSEWGPSPASVSSLR